MSISPFEPRSAKIRRRLVTIPRLFVTFTVATLALPVLFAAAVVVDAFRGLRSGKPWMALRLTAIGWVYLAAEAAGVLALAAAWVVCGFGSLGRPLTTSAYAIQRWWAATMFAAARTIFGLGLTVEGDEQLEAGPIILLFRHASIVDNLLPAVLVSGRHRIRLRWLLKRELLSDPALDVAGNRLPNYFVDRAGDTTVEVANIRALAADLGPGDGVMIYPEGTRFTLDRQERALTRLADGDPKAHAAARGLRHVLPPRTAGTLAVLESAPEAEVVVAAHTGLDGFARVSDIWAGALVGRTIRVAFWRIPRRAIPEGTSARRDWLYEQWQRVDDWIEVHREA